MARSELSALERRWLANPPQAIARIATVDADGMPHVVPGGWSFDSATEEIMYAPLPLRRVAMLTSPQPVVPILTPPATLNKIIPVCI